MPNTAAQLVVYPLFRCGVLFFRGGVGEDVLGNLFSPKDLFKKQVKMLLLISIIMMQYLQLMIQHFFLEKTMKNMVGMITLLPLIL
jgi:hypothetical protein